MSHYLEHMLFMGSERFPDENDYDSYLQHHGGAANAYTEMVIRLSLQHDENKAQEWASRYLFHTASVTTRLHKKSEMTRGMQS